MKCEVSADVNFRVSPAARKSKLCISLTSFDVFLTVHHSIDLFQLPT